MFMICDYVMLYVYGTINPALEYLGNYCNSTLKATVRKNS
jgi:hypothetical protein